jgi:hypothetical protein
VRSRRRIVVIVAASTLALAVTAAVAVTRGDSGEPVAVPAADREPTSTSNATTRPASSTSTLSTSIAASTTGSPASPPSTTPVIIPDIPEAQPEDFIGSLTVHTLNVEVERAFPVSFTVRNASGHAVRLPDPIDGGVLYLGVCTEFMSCRILESYEDAPFAPGEERTYTTWLGTSPPLIGTTPVTVGFVYATRPDILLMSKPFPGVPPAPLTVVAPGWSPGEPPDPSQGRWRAVLTSDAPSVAIGDTIAIHASVTNREAVRQRTRGYGSLAVACEGRNGWSVEMLEPAKLAPGETRPFTVEFQPSVRGDFSCSLVVTYPDYPLTQVAHAEIDSNAVELTVRAGPTSTTSNP